MTANTPAPQVAGPEAALPDLIDIPGGSFTMGRADRRPDERPPHRVSLAPFHAAIAPVTNADFDAFLQHTVIQRTQSAPPPFRADPRFAHPKQPVVGISWFDAVAYCDWLAAATGLPVRLPSEAEREYAASGPLTGVDAPHLDWPWGAADPRDYAPLAFVAQTDAPHVPQPACANGYGLRCMAENVHEWCADRYQRRYDLPPLPVSSAIDPTQRRASRGGSWRHHVKFTRVTARSSLRPDFRYNDYGFRLYASV